MILEIIIFFSAVGFGIFWYWRETVNNTIYRFLNRLFYSEKLQMKPNNRKGFIFHQNIMFKLLYILLFFVALGSMLQFLTPLRIFNSYYGISAFASSVFGTLLGTYLAKFIIKTSSIIDEKSEDLEEFISDTLDDGKAFLEDLNPLNDNEAKATKNVNTSHDTPSKTQKTSSARTRLKDKGYM